jgi:hypothetical protein
MLADRPPERRLEVRPKMCTARGLPETDAGTSSSLPGQPSKVHRMLKRKPARARQSGPESDDWRSANPLTPDKLSNLGQE